MQNRTLLLSSMALVLLLAAGVLAYVFLFSAPQKNAEAERFIIPAGTASARAYVLDRVSMDGFVRSRSILGLLLPRKIEAGGYKISKSMNAWQLSRVFSKPPYMRWVSVPEGLRKEQVADILADDLGWSKEEEQVWLSATATPADYFEGVYFPDTYLIPIDEAPADTVTRLRAKFSENFTPLSKEAAEQNIKWTTALKIASLVQREAAGKNDMPLIAGILWNRLFKKMKLEVDATLQYARGDTGKGWWAPISVADKRIDSPYNTYKYSGLPPHPIANPGLDAIEAVINPAKTDCLYYIHDSSRIIHCAKTYEEHKANIEKFL